MPRAMQRHERNARVPQVGRVDHVLAFHAAALLFQILAPASALTPATILVLLRKKVFEAPLLRRRG